jgi:hypothetical protein
MFYIRPEPIGLKYLHDSFKSFRFTVKFHLFEGKEKTVYVKQKYLLAES